MLNSLHRLVRVVSPTSISATARQISRKSMPLPNDIVEFLHDYPDQDDNQTLTANLRFHRNELRCRPDNLLIDDLHTNWQGDYSTLESNHGFIQWLFPIQEYGMNFHAQPLQPHERAAMRADATVTKRVLRSYKLMLDFYGMQLVSEETGLIGRASAPRNYAHRYRNLVRSSHNNLRISRILKCLSEMGLERFNAGFVLHVLSEQSEHGELNTPIIRSSMDRWWANCIRDEDERTTIGSIISEVRKGKDYVFTRDMYEAALQRRKETGTLGEPI